MSLHNDLPNDATLSSIAASTTTRETEVCNQHNERDLPLLETGLGGNSLQTPSQAHTACLYAYCLIVRGIRCMLRAWR